MIRVDGYVLDYPDDEESRRWRRLVPTPKGRAIERGFVNAAFELKARGRKKSGYAILQDLRDPLGIINTYGPMWSRLARAKHPELIPHLPIKPVGWGKSRKKYDSDDGTKGVKSLRRTPDNLPLFAQRDDDDEEF